MPLVEFVCLSAQPKPIAMTGVLQILQFCHALAMKFHIFWTIRLTKMSLLFSSIDCASYVGCA